MKTSGRWMAILVSASLLLALLMQVPQLLYQLQPQSEGILVQLTSDEPMYLARLAQVLVGDAGHASEPFTGDTRVQGLHLPLIEQVEGFLFSFTGFRSATVLQIMDSVIPPLLFLLLFAFFFLAGFSKRKSLCGALLFVLPLLYSLNRPIHQRTSFLLVLLCLVFLILAIERRSFLLAIPAGALLGLLVGVYFWSWTYAWTYVGLLVCVEGAAWLRNHSRGPFLSSRFGVLLAVIVVGGLAASPFILEMKSLIGDSLSAEVAFRQGMHASRLPESWVYSALFLAMSAGVLLAALRSAKLRGSHRYAILVPVAAFVVLNQQLVHGQVFLFFSHYAFPLAFGAVASVLLGSLLIDRFLLLPLLSGVVILLGIAHDNRYVTQQFSILPERYSEQHFASLLPVLDPLSRSVILSDVHASAFLAGNTQHDILYSIYLESALIESREIARRYCMTQLFVPPDLRHISEQKWLVYPDADSANPGTDVREKEVKMVEEECAMIDDDPAEALRSFGVKYILWDEKRQPQWDLTRLKALSELMREDTGNWALYRVVQ